MDYLPIFVNLKQRSVLVIGGGEVALRKIELLHKAQAQIKIIARTLCPAILHYVNTNQVDWLDHDFNPHHLDNIDLVIAATDEHELNQQVYQLATQQHILVNSVDDLANCSFIIPAIIDRSPVVVAVSSAGTSPVLTKLLRAKLEVLLPHSLANTAKLLGKWRDKVKSHFNKVGQRRQFWQQLLSSPFMQLAESNNMMQAEQFLHSFLDNVQNASGHVTLVGAGPGDPELLTLKALRTISQADIVFYDALVSDEILQLIRSDAEKVFVGKRANQHSLAQAEINQLLIAHAKKGFDVVRLKGGDPFIFGRGGEELQALKRENIPFSIIPGITAAIGAAAYSGIALTHRELAHSVTFITGFHTKYTAEINWPLLAQTNHTLVIYMGIIHITEIKQQLTTYGRLATTPVAIISHATQPNQTVITGQLTELERLSKNVATPALIIIGEVVNLHQQLKWFAVGASGCV